MQARRLRRIGVGMAIVGVLLAGGYVALQQYVRRAAKVHVDPIPVKLGSGISADLLRQPATLKLALDATFIPGTLEHRLGDHVIRAKLSQANTLKIEAEVNLSGKGHQVTITPTRFDAEFEHGVEISYDGFTASLSHVIYDSDNQSARPTNTQIQVVSSLLAMLGIEPLAGAPVDASAGVQLVRAVNLRDCTLTLTDGATVHVAGQTLAFAGPKSSVRLTGTALPLNGWTVAGQIDLDATLSPATRLALGELVISGGTSQLRAGAAYVRNASDEQLKLRDAGATLAFKGAAIQQSPGTFRTTLTSGELKVISGVIRRSASGDEAAIEAQGALSLGEVKAPVGGGSAQARSVDLPDVRIAFAQVASAPAAPALKIDVHGGANVQDWSVNIGNGASAGGLHLGGESVALEPFAVGRLQDIVVRPGGGVVAGRITATAPGRKIVALAGKARLSLALPDGTRPLLVLFPQKQANGAHSPLTVQGQFEDLFVQAGDYAIRMPDAAAQLTLNPGSAVPVSGSASTTIKGSEVAAALDKSLQSVAQQKLGKVKLTSAAATAPDFALSSKFEIGADRAVRVALAAKPGLLVHLSGVGADGQAMGADLLLDELSGEGELSSGTGKLFADARLSIPANVCVYDAGLGKAFLYSTNISVSVGGDLKWSKGGGKGVFFRPAILFTNPDESIRVHLHGRDVVGDIGVPDADAVIRPVDIPDFNIEIEDGFGHLVCSNPLAAVPTFARRWFRLR